LDFLKYELHKVIADHFSTAKLSVLYHANAAEHVAQTEEVQKKNVRSSVRDQGPGKIYTGNHGF
jgi:hypothetical protein